MNATPEIDPGAPSHGRARFELILAGAALAFGLFVLPWLIYVVGGVLMGPYGENQGLGSFYGDYFRDLIEPAGRAWAIALGPLVLLTAMRAVFIGVKEPPQAGRAEPNEHTPPPRRREEPQRLEPRVTLD